MNCLSGAILAFLYYWPTGRVGVLTGTRHGYVRRPFPSIPHFACFVGRYAVHYNCEGEIPWWRKAHYNGTFRMELTEEGTQT